MRKYCAALSLALTQPACAADFAWFGGGDELNAELRYGAADKSETPITFYCTPHVDIVYVEYSFRPANATEAMDVDFTLDAGGVTIEVAAVGYTIGDTGFVLEGQIIFDRTFVDFISAGGTLTATAEGKVQAFPLEGAKAVSGPLLETCGKDVP